MLNSHVENLPSKHDDTNNQNHQLLVENEVILPTSPTSPQRTYLLCTHLNLSATNITNCEFLSALGRLKVIDLSHNEIKELPAVCKSIRTLTYVDVSHNHLSNFPEWILLLENALTIKLGNNPMNSSFQPYFKKANWKKVQTCSLENLNLGLMPECILSSRYLQHFTFGSTTKVDGCESNCLWMMPQVLPASITALDVCSINLSSLDHNWQDHSKLKKFSAQGNNLSWIPDNFLNLTGLEECNLSSCGLFLLPNQINSLTSLRVLNLSFNMLTSIPKSLELLVHLEQLDLYGNKIENVQCNLKHLKRLEGCDLWLNCIDPIDHHPQHEELCKNLRTKFNMSDRVTVQETTDREIEENTWNEPIYSCESSISEEEDNDSGHDTLLAIEGTPTNQAVDQSGLSNEDNWDEPFECNESSKPFNLLEVRAKLEECFLPAAQHASTYVSAPNAFPIVYFF